jgi:hypothetical protein
VGFETHSLGTWITCNTLYVISFVYMCVKSAYNAPVESMGSYATDHS